MSIGPVSSLTSVYASSYSLQISSSSQSTAATGSTKFTDSIASRFLKKNDKDGNGSLSSSELSLSKDAFSQLDTNGDGQLSSDEIKAGVQKQLDALKKAFESGGAEGVQSLLSSAKGTPQGEILSALFPQLANGASGVGQASYSGHRHSFDAGKVADKATAKFIAKNDTDGDGDLSSSEISGLSASDFKALDTNNDGKLSADEIKSVVQKQVQGLHDAVKSGGKSGAQDYLNSIKDTPEGNLLKSVIPRMFGASSNNNKTNEASIQSGSVFFLSIVIQQSQTTVTTNSTNLSGLNVNTTV